MISVHVVTTQRTLWYVPDPINEIAIVIKRAKHLGRLMKGDGTSTKEKLERERGQERRGRRT